MTDADIHAFGAPAPPPAPASRAPRIGRWLLAAAIVFVLLAAAVGALAWLLLAEAAREGINVVVNGEPWLGADFDGPLALPGLLGVGLAVTAAVVGVVLVVSLVVPLSLLLAFLAVALGLGVALLAVLVVAGVALSPLWLILLLLWLLLRRKPAPAATMRG